MIGKRFSCGRHRARGTARCAFARPHQQVRSLAGSGSDPHPCRNLPSGSPVTGRRDVRRDLRRRAPRQVAVRLTCPGYPLPRPVGVDRGHRRVRRPRREGGRRRLGPGRAAPPARGGGSRCCSPPADRRVNRGLPAGSRRSSHRSPVTSDGSQRLVSVLHDARPAGCVRSGQPRTARRFATVVSPLAGDVRRLAKAGIGTPRRPARRLVTYQSCLPALSSGVGAHAAATPPASPPARTAHRLCAYTGGSRCRWR
jgi:hypothetical protein